ncbi:Hypothetical protein NocV09_02100140 [Nannochloropsis oceanica]
MHDDNGVNMEVTSLQEQNPPSSSSTPPSPLGLQGPALLSSFHATYRSLFHHLPASLRPPGIQFLEDAEYPPKPSSSSFRRGSGGRGVGGSSPSLPSSLPPLTTLRWASRRMRRAIRLCLARVAQDEEEGGVEGVLAPLTPEEQESLGFLDFTERAWALMELAYFSNDGQGMGGWEVVAWAQPYWGGGGDWREGGRDGGPEAPWRRAWELVLMGEMEEAASVLDGVGVWEEGRAGGRDWFWPSWDLKERLLGLLISCPLVRAMAVLREEEAVEEEAEEEMARRAAARGRLGVDLPLPSDSGFEATRLDVARSLAREGERWRRDILRELTSLPPLPSSSSSSSSSSRTRSSAASSFSPSTLMGVRRLLEMLAGREGAAERTVRALEGGREGGRSRGRKGWRLRFAGKVLFENPGLKGREVALALEEARREGGREGGGAGGEQVPADDDSCDAILKAVLGRDVGPLLVALSSRSSSSSSSSTTNTSSSGDTPAPPPNLPLAALYHLVLLLDLTSSVTPSLRSLRTPALAAKRSSLLASFLSSSLLPHRWWRPALSYALGSAETEEEVGEGKGEGLKQAAEVLRLLGPFLADESAETRRWLATVGMAGREGGREGPLVVAWMEASVVGGDYAWRRYEEGVKEGGREGGFERALEAVRVAVRLWSGSDWGRRELRDRLEGLSESFLGLMARLVDVLEAPLAHISVPPSSSSSFSLGEMERIAGAIVEAVAVEEAEKGGRKGGREGAAVFPVASALVTTQCPELSVLYGCRLSLARLAGKGGREGGREEENDLTAALGPLLATLPPLGGVCPKRLWPCAGALLTCLAEEQVSPRRGEFLGREGGREGWSQARRQTLAMVMGKAFVEERKLKAAWATARARGGSTGGGGGGGAVGGGGGVGGREPVIDLLGPPML